MPNNVFRLFTFYAHNFTLFFRYFFVIRRAFLSSVFFLLYFSVSLSLFVALLAHVWCAGCRRFESRFFAFSFILPFFGSHALVIRGHFGTSAGNSINWKVTWKTNNLHLSFFIFSHVCVCMRMSIFRSVQIQAREGYIYVSLRRCWIVLFSCSFLCFLRLFRLCTDFQCMKIN